MPLSKMIKSAPFRQSIGKILSAGSLKPTLVCAVASRRLYAAASKSDLSVSTAPGSPSVASTISSLKSAFDAEIEYEKQTEGEGADQGVPETMSEYLRKNKLALSENAGLAVSSLSTQKDGVQMNILFDVRQVYADETRFEEDDAEEEDSANEDAEEEAADTDSPISLRVELTKPNGKLTLEVLLGEDYTNVSNMLFSKPSETPTDNTSEFLVPVNKEAKFFGPNYNDLSEDLQDAVNNYVTSLGVNGDMYAFLRAYMDQKEKSEYALWLSNTRKFF